MAGSFLVNLTRGLDDPDRATVALVVANAAAASGVETVIFLSSDGVVLGVQGGGDSIAESGFKPMRDLLQSFADAGGKLWVCPPCFKKRELSEADLLPNAIMAGGAKMVEFLVNGAGSVSY